MTNPKRRTPAAVYKAVCVRADGLWLGRRCNLGKCEFCHDRNLDWRGHCFAHLVHRKLGGTTDPAVHSAENIRYSCYPCHDFLDGRRHQLAYISPALKEARERKEFAIR